MHDIMVEGERVRHRMGDRGPRIREGKPREESGARLPPAQLEAREVVDELRQHLQDLLSSLDSEDRRDRVRAHVPEALERVRERVEARRKCEGARGGERQFGIDDRDPGIERRVRKGVFLALRRVPHRRPGGDLGRRCRRSTGPR